MTTTVEGADIVAAAIQRARDHGANDVATADDVMRALLTAGWSLGPPGPPEGQVRFQFDAPADAPPSLRCLWVVVRAWEVSTEGLSAREKDRCIAYLTSLLQGERRSQEATVTVHDGAGRVVR